MNTVAPGPVRFNLMRSASNPNRRAKAAASGEERRASRAERPGPGRRAGKPNTRELIVRCARARFNAHGYNGTTMRQVAADAGVDVALVHYFFGTKDGLFSAAMALSVSPADAVAEVLAEGTDELGARLLRTVLRIWDDPESGDPLLALVRSAATHEEAAVLLRQFIEREALGRLARAVELPEPELRTSLVASQVIGLLFTRYVLRIGPLASAEPETLVAAIGPVLDHYLTGTLGE